MKIIGVSGTNGSGKDTVMQMLAERHDYLVVSATDLIHAELDETGQEKTRANKAALTAKWRREMGLDALIQKAVKVFEETDDKAGLVVGSLRHPAEAEAIQNHDGIVIWVDADPEVRYQRVQANLRKGRDAEDRKTFKEWQADEKREWTPVGDEATLNVSGVKDKADIFVFNNDNDIEAFKDQVEDELKDYLEA